MVDLGDAVAKRKAAAPRANSRSRGAMNSKLTHRLLPLSEAGVAEAGDCLEAPRGLFCLPAVVNIGVQKAGTGELQTWLGAHPLMLAHGGEVHFFDGLRPSAAMLRCGQRQRTNLRQRYARHLWHRRPLSRDNVGAAASSAMAAGAPLVRWRPHVRKG